MPKHGEEENKYSNSNRRQCDPETHRKQVLETLQAVPIDNLCTVPVRHLSIKSTHEPEIVQVAVVHCRLQTHCQSQLVGEGLGTRYTIETGYVVV